MTSSTLLFLPSDFFSKFFEYSETMAIGLIEAILKTTFINLIPYWPYIFGSLFILLIVASVKALFGRVGMFGSLLYHVFYFSILTIIVLISGMGIVFNPFFDLICFSIYRFCYWMVGLILQRFR
jgi:hypothetical protein